MKKMLFLYLDTGGGHKAPANALKTLVEQQDKNVKVYVESALTKKNKITKLLIEKSYHFCMLYCSYLFSFLYLITPFRWMHSCINCLFERVYAKNIKNLIEKYEITDIVSFHFLINPSIVKLCKKYFPNIKFSVICLDPFTAHSVWFYEKNVQYYVYSQTVKNFAIQKCHIPQENVEIVPFILNQKFNTKIDNEQKNELRKKYNFPQHKKMILISLGGEGELNRTKKLVRSLIKQKVDATVIIICGKAEKSKILLQNFVSKQMQKNIFSTDFRILGYIDYMSDLIKISDYAVIKAGASSVMEFIVSKIPFIIFKYVYGQELGNMQFAVKYGFAKYIKKTDCVAKQIKDFCSTNENSQTTSLNDWENKLQNALKEISVDSEKTANIILER